MAGKTSEKNPKSNFHANISVKNVFFLSDVCIRKQDLYVENILVVNFFFLFHLYEKHSKSTFLVKN